MSYSDGWAAMNLEMPARIPHTETALVTHAELIREVTGIVVKPNSPAEVSTQASFALMKAINLDFRRNTLLHHQPFGDLRTRMINDEPPGSSGERRVIIDCPFRSEEDVRRFNFEKNFGVPDRAAWKAKFEADYRRCSEETPDLVNTTGIASTLISGLLDIFGWHLMLMSAGTDPQAFGAVANRYAAWILPYFEALADSNIPLVLIQDDFVWDAGPIFMPGWYRTFLFPNYKKLFAPLLEAKKKIIFTSNGNYTKFIDDLAGCGVHGFGMDIHTSLDEVAGKYGQTHVLIGNFNGAVLQGSYAGIRAEVERCVAVGKGCPGFFLAMGSDLPPNVPVENLLYYLDTYEALSKR